MDNNRHPNQPLLEQAIELDNEGQIDEAINLYLKIIELSPDWATPFYNLGLIYKYNYDWQRSFYYNKKATEADANNEAAWWNLGIAATALEDWKSARQAWNAFGWELEVNDDELILDLGSTPVRLNPDGNGEVIWAERIDPARTIIKSVPLPESNHRYNDVLLNDGAPVGYRTSHGKEYPVFNELQLIRLSDFKTFSVLAETDDQNQIDQLGDLCDRNQIGFEDWTTVRLLCKQCSEGIPHDHHDHENNVSFEGKRRLGFAALDKAIIEKILKEWSVLFSVKYSDIVLELA
jgi:tetratricopeptide (TPR) repeat protein